MGKRKIFLLHLLCFFLLISGCGELMNSGSSSSSENSSVSTTTSSSSSTSSSSNTSSSSSENSSSSTSSAPRIWQDVGSPAFSDGEVDQLCFSAYPYSYGALYVAYKDALSNRVVVKRAFFGANWQNLGSGYASDESPDLISLAVDNNGTPVLAYQFYDSSRVTRVKKFDSSWQQIGYGISNISYHPFIISSYYGVPYLACSSGGFARVIKYDYDQTSWTNVGEFFYSQPANYLSFLIYNGMPYVAYKHDGSLRGKISKFDGSAWVDVGPMGDPYFGTSIDYVSMGIYSDEPYVAYRDSDKKIYVKKLHIGSGGTWWVDLGAIGTCNDDLVKNILSLSLDANGWVYVAYRDTTLGNKVVVKRCTNANSDEPVWEMVGNTPASSGAGSWITLIVIQGVPYVAYKDEANGGKVTVRKYE